MTSPRRARWSAGRAWHEWQRRRHERAQAEWDALPLATRVRLCAECGWLDAVWEACPSLGRWIDRQRRDPVTFDGEQGDQTVSETPYAETELLLAVMNDDTDRAVALAEDMFPNERRRFIEQLHQAADIVNHLCDACGRYVPPTPRPDNAWTSPPARPDDRILVTLAPLSAARESKVWHRRCAPERFR